MLRRGLIDWMDERSGAVISVDQVYSQVSWSFCRSVDVEVCVVETSLNDVEKEEGWIGYQSVSKYIVEKEILKVTIVV